MTESQHFVGKVSQRAIISHAGKFLLELDVGSKHWDVPGGRLHRNEKPSEGLKREIREEIGVEIEPQSVIHTDVEQYSDGSWTYMVYYAAQLRDPSEQLTLDPQEVVETKWCTLEEIATLPLYPGVKVALQKYQV